MAFDLSNYETVEDRLIRFWADHPDGRIATTLVAQDGDQVIFRAEVFFEYLDTLPKGDRVRRRDPWLIASQQNRARGEL
jgi:hypothetical protein